MQRSKSLEQFSTQSHGCDSSWNDEATERAMLDIIQSDSKDATAQGVREGNGQEAGVDIDESVWRNLNGEQLLSFRENTYPRVSSHRKIPHNLDHISGVVFPVLRPGPERVRTKYDSSVDADIKREKEYIVRSRLPRYTQGPFKTMILQTFYKPPRSKPICYGNPGPVIGDCCATKNTPSSVTKIYPSFVKVRKHKSLCVPTLCEHHKGYGQQYCDILGPGTCSKCIENTNRHIAYTIQKTLFPTMEVSSACLVVPKLSKVMKEGHMKQLKKLKVQDLNFLEANRDFPRQTRPSTWEAVPIRSSSSKMSTCGSSLPSMSVCSTSTYTMKSVLSGW